MRVRSWMGGRRLRLGVLVLLLACTLAARVPGFGYALWQDEIGAERVIRKPTVDAALDEVVARESTPPLFYLAGWGVGRITGAVAARDDAAVLLRALPLIFSLGTTLLTFALALRLLPLWAAALAGVLVGFGSELVLHGTELRAYSLLAFSCAAFAYALAAAAEQPRGGRLAAVAGIVGVGSLTHYFFLLTLAAGVVWLLSAGLDRAAVRRIGVALAVGLIPFAAWTPSWVRQYENQNYGTSPEFTPARLAEVVPTLFAPQALVAELGWLGEAAAFLVVVGAAVLLLTRGRELQLCAFCALLPLAATAGVAAFGPRIFNARNLIGIAPFAAIALAALCASLRGGRARSLAAGLASALVVAGYALGQAQLGRTPYDGIALSAVEHGFAKGEPTIWFGRYGGFYPVRWYLALYAPGGMRPRLTAADLERGRCGAVTAIARGDRGRRWLDRHRASIRAQAALPSYGDAPQDRRNRHDVVVVRLRWTPGIFRDALADEGTLFHRRGPVSPCRGDDVATAHVGNAADARPPASAGRIAFSVYRHGNNELHAVNADGSGRRRLTPEQAGGSSPAWSPGGRWIAFASYRDGNDDVYIMDADGTEQRRLTQGSADEGHPAWSPDARTIAFDDRGRHGRSRIVVLEIDGGERRALTPEALDAAHPAWSPDGRELAFDAVRGGTAGIYVMRADGTRLRRLTQDGDAFPAWSPDARKLAFASVRDGNSEIYVMAADGTRQRRLTRDDAFDSEPAWSADGRAIVFTSTLDDGVDGDIHVMSAAGSGRRRITWNDFPTSDPAWR